MPVDGVVEREPGSDLSASDRAGRAIDELFEAVLDDTGDAHVRRLVSESWQRSLAAAIDPSTPLPPLRFDPAEGRARLDAHPLHQVMPLLRANLVSIAEEAKHVVVVTDETGTVLWRDGASAVLGPADRVGLVEGSCWSEEAIGTNAMGTGLALGRPVQIHSTEHLVRAVHAWTCVAAPVVDPDTGRIIGAIDITGPRRTIHPAMLALVTATAQLAENQMRMRLAIADERLRARNEGHLASLRGTPGALVTPTGRIIAGDPFGSWPERVDLAGGADRVRLADGREMHVEPLAEGYLLTATRRTASAPEPRRHALTLRFLGDGNPTVVLDGECHALTLRPAEILTALALNPEGLTAERLAFLLYGDDGNQTTVRGEIHRLRALIGTDVLKTRPYRLDAVVDTDFGSVRRALREGRVAEALRACGGPLLPRSDAPEIRGARDELEVGLRRAVLESDDVELVHAYANHRLGRDDLEAHELLVDMLPAGDPRRAVAESRAARLLNE
ncbi:helix-turn-helix domain-containing protein [Pseudonocardia pini]|uniref:helix-turn-helix domain-containing protein n=1 Tax=Pseudonocardia pini TaxID=2758030 RepID=UPI0015F03CAE|nr:helix-turn-helix domain-containing protein [Pseudonocardia pini]